MSTTIQFSYSKSQVLQALRYHFISKKEIRILIIVINVFALFAAAMFFWKKIAPLPFLLLSVMWIVLMVSIWFILPFSIYSRTKTFRDRFTLTFLDGYMHLENRLGAKDWNYQQFRYVVETPNFFHLYADERSFFLVPKDAFEDSDATHAVRLLLREKIGNK
ncbi:MAG TPA: YcxB family protein [Lacibacter sp.]|nr:YcxB family protein [Lacibacter sp.]HMO88006.1 YcxB family protein [Lacibacter sp.]HMP87340.1 YcxB family protein [Lacibacter sp.]